MPVIIYSANRKTWAPRNNSVNHLLFVEQSETTFYLQESYDYKSLQGEFLAVRELFQIAQQMIIPDF